MQKQIQIIYESNLIKQFVKNTELDIAGEGENIKRNITEVAKEELGIMKDKRSKHGYTANAKNKWKKRERYG